MAGAGINAGIVHGASDKNGAYTFWNVDPGEYCVRILDITIPAGYFRTTPGRVPVWIASGSHLSGVHFGFRESYPSYPQPRMAEALCYLEGPDARLTLLSAGAVIILYSFTIPRRVAS